MIEFKSVYRNGMIVKLYGWIFLLLVCGNIFGSINPVSKKYNTQNILLSNEVYSVVADFKGYVWMATSRGVVRFDGKNSVYFSTNNGLSDQVVLKLFLSPKGKLWVYCADKTLYYLNSESRFVEYKHAELLKQALNTNNFSEICAIYFKNEEPQYFATTMHGLLYVKKRKVLTYLPQLKGVIFNREIGLAGYRVNPNFDIHFNNKVYKVTGNVKHPNTLIRSNKDIVFTIDNYLFVLRDNKVVHEATFSGLILSVYEDKEKSLWISFYNKGVKRYKEGETINQQGGSFFFDNDMITGVCQDFEGGYWFSTHTNGVTYVPKFSFFEIIKENISNIRAVTTDEKGRMYVVTDDKQIIRYTGNKPDTKVSVLSGPQSSVCNDICYRSFDNKLYVSFSHGIYAVDEHLRLSNRVISGSKGVFFASDKKHLYTISAHVAAKIRMKDNVVVHRATVNETTVTLFEDSRGIMWIGTNSGLLVFKNDTVTKVFRSTIHDRVSKIQQLPTGELVVGTIGQGIYVIDRNGNIDHILMGADVRKNTINDICIMGNELWTATGDGIIVVRYIGKHQFDWYQYDGSFREIRKIITSQGKMYLWTDNSVVEMQLLSSLVSPAHPRLVLDSILVNGNFYKPVRPTVLSYNENNVKIYFHTISFRFGKTISYRYRLSGLDTTWKRINHSELEFESLPPGKYLVQILAMSPDGLQSLSPITIPFVIKEPFWMNWVLISLGIAFLLAVAVLILITVYKKKMRVNMERERYIYMEQQALSAQINPHFIFNALNSIQNVIMVEPQLKALQYLGQFSVLMRLSLENARQKWVLPSEEMRLISVYLELEKLRFKHKFTFTVSYEQTDNQKEVLIPSMLIQPFVENAILHGVNHLETRTGSIDVRLTFDGLHLVCVVDDNGVGRRQAALFESKHAKQNRSFGVQITCERLQILSKQMKRNYYYEVIDKVDDLNEPIGTKVIFNIPFKDQE